MHYWEATSEALSLFESQLKPAIISFLREHSEKAQESGSYLSIPLFMIGKRPEKTKPTVMFISDDKEARKEAFDLVKESGIMAKYPGYELGHSGFEKLIALAGSPIPVFSTPGESVGSRQVFHFSAADAAQNTRIVAAGNVVSYRGKYMYLTVDHSLDSSHPASPTTAAENTNEGIDCEITGLGDFDDDDDDNDEGDDSNLMHVTSRASISVASESGGSERDSSVSGNSSEGTLDAPSYFSPTSGTGPEPLGLIPLMESCIAVGSTIIRSKELDYALVELGSGVDSAAMHEHAIPLDDASRIESGPRDAAVVTTTPDGRIVRGALSSSPYHVRLPGRKNFIGAYAVRFSRPLNPGDCGSLVIDVDTGRVFGHVFAGSPTDGLTAIMPASLVFGDAVTLLEKLCWPDNNKLETGQCQEQQLVTQSTTRAMSIPICGEEVQDPPPIQERKVSHLPSTTWDNARAKTYFPQGPQLPGLQSSTTNHKFKITKPLSPRVRRPRVRSVLASSRMETLDSGCNNGRMMDIQQYLAADLDTLILPPLAAETDFFPQAQNPDSALDMVLSDPSTDSMANLHPQLVDTTFSQDWDPFSPIYSRLSSPEVTDGVSDDYFSSIASGSGSSTRDPSSKYSTASDSLTADSSLKYSSASNSWSSGSASTTESQVTDSILPRRRLSGETESARDHPLYKNAQPQADGLYHCPWEGEMTCNHKPEKLRCNYE